MKTRTPIRIDEALKEAISDSGFNLNGISAGTGIALSILTRFMSGERSMRFDTAAVLAEYLGLRLTSAVDVERFDESAKMPS